MGLSKAVWLAIQTDSQAFIAYWSSSNRYTTNKLQSLTFISIIIKIIMIYLLILTLCIHTALCSFYYSNQSLSIGKQITHIQISANNQLLLISSQNTSTHKSNLHIYYKFANQFVYTEIEVLSVDLGIINFMILAKQRNLLLLGLRNNNIQLYQTNENNMPELIYSIDGWNMEEKQIDFSLDSNYIAMGNKNHSISCYEKSLQPIANGTYKLVYKLIDTIKTDSEISCLKISPNSSRLYVAYANYTLCIYNLLNTHYEYDTKIQYKDDVVTQIHLSELGKIMIIGTQKGKIRIYVPDSKGRGLYQNQVIDQTKVQIIKIRVSTNGLMMLVTDIDRQVYQFSRISDNYNWIYDEDKSDRFKNVSYTFHQNSNLTQKHNNSSWSTPPPQLSSDDSIIIHPITQTSLSLMVSCNISHKNCNRCLNSSRCQSCNQYYYFSNPLLINSMQINPCLPCQRGCLYCVNRQSCLNCDTSSYLDPLVGICISCNRQIVNCKKCQSKKTCIECADGYELDNNSCEMNHRANESPNKIYDLRQQVAKNNDKATGNQILTIFIIISVVVTFLLGGAMAALYCVLKIMRRQNSMIESGIAGVQSERSLNRIQ